MRLPIAALSLALGLLAPAAAYASPINPDVTFYLNGATLESYNNSQGLVTMYGSVTINTVTGTVVSENIFVDNEHLPEVGPYSLRYIFSSPVSAGEQGPGIYGIGTSYGVLVPASAGSSLLGGLDLEIPGTSLVGYTGGSICGIDNYINNYSLCNGALTTLDTGNYDENTAYAFGGTLSEIDPTPEPSSLVLLGTGMAGVAAMARRRFRRS